MGRRIGWIVSYFNNYACLFVRKKEAEDTHMYTHSHPSWLLRACLSILAKILGRKKKYHLGPGQAVDRVWTR